MPEVAPIVILLGRRPRASPRLGLASHDGERRPRASPRLERRPRASPRFDRRPRASPSLGRRPRDSPRLEQRPLASSRFGRCLVVLDVVVVVMRLRREGDELGSLQRQQGQRHIRKWDGPVGIGEGREDLAGEDAPEGGSPSSSLGGRRAMGDERRCRTAGQASTTATERCRGGSNQARRPALDVAVA